MKAGTAVHFLRFVAGPIAASLLMLAPASMPVFAQAAPTADEVAYQTAMNTATSDISPLLLEKDAMDARLAGVTATTDFVALNTDLGALKGRWQAVTDRVIALQPPPRYSDVNLHMAIATQTFAEGYGALATALNNADAPGIATATQGITTAKTLLFAVGTEFSAA